MTLQVYTDGGASPNNENGVGGWAVVIPQQGNLPKTYQIWGGKHPSTSNAMEVTAGIKALEFIKDHNLYETFDSVEVISDSAYHVNGANKWAHNWKANNWKKAGNESIKNLELWVSLLGLKSNFPVPVKWSWVKAHNGDEHNEECDALVGIAINEEKNNG